MRFQIFFVVCQSLALFAFADEAASMKDEDIQGLKIRKGALGIQSSRALKKKKKKKKKKQNQWYGAGNQYKYKKGKKKSNNKNTNLSLFANLQLFPEATGTAPTGKVQANFAPNGVLTSFSVNGQNLGLSCPNADGCGIGIYEGTSCSSVDTIGDSYYQTTSDPFTDTKYTSSVAGVATRSFTTVPAGGNGYFISQNFGHIVIIDDEDGNGVACGVLLRSSGGNWNSNPWSSNNSNTWSSNNSNQWW
jgi:hypothetical protein